MKGLSDPFPKIKEKKTETSEKEKSIILILYGNSRRKKLVS
jgi:hypothetical protein